MNLVIIDNLIFESNPELILKFYDLLQTEEYYPDSKLFLLYLSIFLPENFVHSRLLDTIKKFFHYGSEKLLSDRE